MAAHKLVAHAAAGLAAISLLDHHGIEPLGLSNGP
jgi:hypothetical protein